MDATAMEDGVVRETGATTVLRHRLTTRLWHWVNAIAVIILLMSGLMILNAHPRLYWGEYGANFDEAWLELSPIPGWATIPSNYDLAGGRRWHFAFAWIFGIGFVLFAAVSLLNGHFRRDIVPAGEEVRPRRLWQEIRNHARLRFPVGEAAARYNVLQKLSYGLVIFILIPVQILSGLAMSPMMDAAWPWLLDLFGGRQSARSVHFIVAVMLGLFIAVHLIMVLLAGPVNEIRSMVTGRFPIEPEGKA